MKLGIISLGCAKNLYDSEMILGTCKSMVELCDDANEADLILINTCAFIESARREAIDTILSLSDYKNAKLWYSKIKSRQSFKEILNDRIKGIYPSKNYSNLDF